MKCRLLHHNKKCPELCSAFQRMRLKRPKYPEIPFSRPMKKILLIVLLLAFSEGSANAQQNAFLQLYHPKNKEVGKLRTDSLHIYEPGGTRGIQLRRVIYHYDNEGLYTGMQEWYYDTLQLLSREITKTLKRDDNRLNVEEEIKNNKGASIYKDQTIETYKADGQIDSLELSVWDNNHWIPQQKTKYLYHDNGMLLSRLDYSRDLQGKEWIPAWGESYSYDAKRRLLTRNYMNWDNTGQTWVILNAYEYEYSGNKGEPTLLIWRNRQNGIMINMEQTKIDFKPNGQKDTISIYRWDPSDSLWIRRSFTVLESEEPNQRFELGACYTLGKEGKWEKVEEVLFSPGDNLYTDEIETFRIRSYDEATQKWYDKKQEITRYIDLPDGKRVQGRYEKEVTDPTSRRQQQLLADAWFTRKDPERPVTVDSREGRNTYDIAKNCGITNPYIWGRNIVLPDTGANTNSSYELRITSEEGRLIWSRTGGNATFYMDAQLPPGLYWVSANKGNSPVCTQKLLVKE